MLQGIAQTRDLDSLEDVLKALDDDAYVVRVQAISAVQRLLFFGQLFKPDAPHEVRVEAIKKARKRMVDMKIEEKREIELGWGKKK